MRKSAREQMAEEYDYDIEEMTEAKDHNISSYRFQEKALEE